MNEQLNSDPVLARDDGFHPVTEVAQITLAPDTAPTSLSDHLDLPLIAIDFPSFSDGRGFTLARLLREAGYTGRLRATGRLIADQYAMARRVGFDEVQVAPDIAARQPEDQWRARADWKAWDHRAHLAG
ncbi:DUF934 domain-containing protein [Paracoccus liaowanqingii]|uniref:DUF934 domain-containing protein n=1 Tax=Paracoccus liaowanqingii TaxID=2560053 RepID=A0A4Z1CT32_9RHOB|nr:DUF934 domain-containing protein [Paracoccus liaowanqingii]TGN68486.1 DUF934 domain-containing protein [Paracoccus liaowanqingii]